LIKGDKVVGSGAGRWQKPIMGFSVSRGGLRIRFVNHPDRVKNSLDKEEWKV